MPAKRYVADDFVSAALGILRAGSGHQLTLKAVGDAVGANTTAVYRHFPSKEALLAAMVDRVLAEMVDSDEPVLDPMADLVLIARTMRRIQVDFPLLAEVISGTEIFAPNAIRLSRRVIDNLSLLGLKGDELVSYYQALENFVLGASWNDGVGRPGNWEIRRQRYELLARPGFSDASVELVATLSENAYIAGVRAILSEALHAIQLREEASR